MRILAIDTSSNVAAAAVTEDGRLKGEYILNHKKTHSQKIMPMLDELMRSLEIEPADIDLFAAVCGPGSFTGIRIGAAAVKTLAQVTKKPVVAVNTLEGLMYNLPFCGDIVVPMIDARRSDVYFAAYKNGKEIKAPCAEDIKQCVSYVDELGENTVFLGDGAFFHEEYLRDALGSRALFAPINLNEQRASSVAACAMDKYKKGDVIDYGQLEPLYIRKSQAEREYDEKQKKIRKGI